jgi:hypothetical protein
MLIPAGVYEVSEFLYTEFWPPRCFYLSGASNTNRRLYYKVPKVSTLP